MWILFIIFAIVVMAICIYENSKNAESHETTQAKLAAKMYGNHPADDAFDLADDIERMRQMAEAMIQAKAAGHDDDYEAIMNGTYRGPLADESFPYRCECHIYQAEDEDDGHKFFY